MLAVPTHRLPSCQFRAHAVHLTWFFLLVCTNCCGQDQSTRFDDYGFEIGEIESDWSIRTPDTGKAGSMMVKATRSKSSGAIELTVSAAPINADVSAISKRNEAIQNTANKPEFSNQEQIEVTLLDRKLPGFKLDWSINGSKYHVEQCYLVEQGFLYTLSIHAPSDEFESLQSTLRDLRESFRLIEISPKKMFEMRLRKLASECGNELNWAKTWRHAAERAKSENKSIVVFLKLQPGFDITDSVSTSALMDAEVIELLNEHCIALRYHKGMKAAINDYTNYGISPTSFGSTILLASPDGKVYADTFVSEPNLFYDFLQQNLRIPEADKIPRDLSGVELARFYARKGHLSSALRQLSDESDAPTMQLKASIHARLLQGDQCLSALEKASLAADDEALKAELQLDKTAIELATGKTSTELALPIFAEFVSEYPSHDRNAEALYMLGICQYSLDKNLDRAKPTWHALIEKHPNGRWARKTAATLLSSGLSAGAQPLIQWPSPEVVEAFRSVDRQTIPVTAVNEAKSNAISYLLATQREDGSWISPADALMVKSYSTSHFTAAVTAVCANALIPFRERTDVLSAIEKAVEYLLSARTERRIETDRPVYMDYSPWGDAYTLLFLASAIQHDVVEKSEVQELANDLVSTLKNSQKKGGGWNYLVSTKLRKTTPGNHSASFMTSAVTIALVRARAEGIEVPEGMIERALLCVEEMKSDSSTFDYFLFHDSGSRTNTGIEGAAGRGPLCSLALFLGGKGSKAEIKNCIEIFVKHSDNYVRETGKSLMHAAPGSQGSHYLMFDYDWAAQAWSVLADQDRPKLQRRLTEMILAAHSKQGGFIDNPINGWHYGTGMALHALTILTE